MRRARIIGLALAMGGAVAISGFVWLPVPTEFGRRILAEQGAGFDVTGAAQLRWATGELRARDARLTWNGVELGRAAWVGVNLDLRPWRRAAAPLARVEVGGAVVALDEAAVRALLGPKRPPSGEAVGFEVRVTDGSGTWRLNDGTLVALEDLEGRCVGWPGPDGRLLLGIEGDGRLTAPAAARVEARVQVDPRRADWRAEVLVEAADLPPLRQLGLAGGGQAAAEWMGLEWRRADLTARLLIDPARWLVDAEADARDVRHPRAPLALDAVHCSVQGDARSVLRAQVDASTARGEVRATVDATRAPAAATAAAWSGWCLDALARVARVDLDQALRADLAHVSPAAVEALDALGLSGEARGSVRVQAQLDPGSPPPQVLAYAPAAGLGLDYAGFPDSATGERFSCRLPLAAHEGGVAWAGGALLIRAAGVLGEADSDPHGDAAGQPPARVAATGVVEIGRASARTALDLHAQHLSPSPRLGAALTANRALADLWRDLGDPRGGAAEARVQVRPQGASHAVRVRVTAEGVDMSPPRLGLPVHVARAVVAFEEGRVQADATAVTGGWTIESRTRMRALAGAADAQVWSGGFALRGAPDAAAWARLAEQWPAASLLSDLQLQGVTEIHGDFRAEVAAGGALVAPSWHATVRSNALAATWLPVSQTVQVNDLRAGASGGAGGVVAEWTDAAGAWNEGTWSSSGRLRLGAPGAGVDGSAVASVRGALVDDAALRAALAPLGVQPWTQRMSLGGVFSANVDLPFATPEDAEVRLDLEPLVVLLPAGALQRAARREAARFELAGRLHASAGQLATSSLLLTGPDVELELRDCAGRYQATGLSLHGQAVSARGLRIRPPLGLVAPQSVLNSLDRIGLDGDVAPRDLRFELIAPTGGTPTVRARGTVELREFRLDGPPPVREGAGVVECLEFTWRGPEDFTGRFQLTGGSARVAGIGTREARAEILLQRDRVTVTRFAAEALGGRATTEWLDASGGARAGGFELGLAGNAAIRSEFRFDDFQLEQLGEELGFRGPLAGRLSGEVAVRGPDPSPIQYRGQVRLDIRDGVLGTVPVLAQLWRVLGIEAPTFSQGELRLSFLGEGRLLVENFSLQHPLLEVTGERILTMDSYLGLKVTVRTFGFFGRLPVIRDVLDFLVEHDVYGPASALRLRQRGLGKLFAGDLERVPFPLWMPRVARPDWRKSPTMPVEGPALRAPALPHP